MSEINETVILFNKIRPDATIPTREKGNAGFDIYGLPPKISDVIVLHPHETKLIPTGIRSVIPEGYYIQIEERGSTGSKGIKYGAGVIDSNYRGEWFLATTNTTNNIVVFYNNSSNMSNDEWEQWFSDEHSLFTNAIFYPFSKAIFQGVIHSTHDNMGVETVSDEEFEKYQTDRGEGKLGSSGK